jgi:uncharacterized membrane protein YozB (DUF420 family)
MSSARRYTPEYLVVGLTILLWGTGFWNVLAGPEAPPDVRQVLHAATSLLWLLLLLYQLELIRRRQHADHRRVGLAILALGPLLFATAGLLSVHSAHKGLVSGEGDFLIVQNVMVTLELGLLTVLAFVLRRNRPLHGSLMLSTAVLFMGIALFFTLTGFVPQYRIEGPETFHRFGEAASAAQTAMFAVGALMFVRNWRTGWPYLLAASFFLLNELIRAALHGHALLDPLTRFVGSLNQAATFGGSFVLLLALLMATGVRGTRRIGAA